MVSPYTLPLEVQNLVLGNLPPSSLNPALNQIFGAILSHHNNLVKELVTTTPVYSMGALTQACLDSDNLEIMKFLAIRMELFSEPIVRSNRTTYWLIEFYHYIGMLKFANIYDEGSSAMFRTGFAIAENYVLDTSVNEVLIAVVNAFCSDLREPLPFTYSQLDRFLPPLEP